MGQPASSAPRTNPSVGPELADVSTRGPVEPNGEEPTGRRPPGELRFTGDHHDRDARADGRFRKSAGAHLVSDGPVGEHRIRSEQNEVGRAHGPNPGGVGNRAGAKSDPSKVPGKKSAFTAGLTFEHGDQRRPSGRGKRRECRQHRSAPADRHHTSGS